MGVEAGYSGIKVINHVLNMVEIILRSPTSLLVSSPPELQNRLSSVFKTLSVESFVIMSLYITSRSLMMMKIERIKSRRDILYLVKISRQLKAIQGLRYVIYSVCLYRLAVVRQNGCTRSGLVRRIKGVIRKVRFRIVHDRDSHKKIWISGRFIPSAMS